MLVVRIIWFLSIFFIISLVYGLACRKIFSNTINTMVQTLILGTIASWAVFYVISVPLIFMKCSMSLLTAVMCVITILLLPIAGSDAKKIGKFQQEEKKQSCIDKRELLLLLLLGILVAKQIYGYVFLQHSDADDAEFVVFATSAIQNNELLTVNPYTGREIWGSLFVKRAMNPFSILIAFYSKLSGIHPAIMCHTVLPVALVLIVYAVCYLVSEKLFKSRSERILFLVFIALMHMFGYTSTFTNSAFFLLRLWQGKAVLAALIMPFVLYGCMNYTVEKRKETIGILVIIGLAGTLTSAISYVVIPLEIMAYFMSQALVQKRLFIVRDGIVACIPSIVCGCMFFVMVYVTGVI